MPSSAKTPLYGTVQQSDHGAKLHIHILVQVLLLSNRNTVSHQKVTQHVSTVSKPCVDNSNTPMLNTREVLHTCIPAIVAVFYHHLLYLHCVSVVNDSVLLMTEGRVAYYGPTSDICDFFLKYVPYTDEICKCLPCIS